MAPWSVYLPVGMCQVTPNPFSYSVATTDKAEDVPQNARRLVRVVDPAKAANDRQDPTKVYAVDLSELLASGKAEARPLSREAFETGALAQLPPGESSPMAGPHGPPLPEDLPAGIDAGALGPLGPPVVIVYGTPWCGACKAAKKYLAGKHIPYAYKDIESDPAAARELQAKAARMGVPTDRVPILDGKARLRLRDIRIFHHRGHRGHRGRRGRGFRIRTLRFSSDSVLSALSVVKSFGEILPREVLAG